MPGTDRYRPTPMDLATTLTTLNTMKADHLEVGNAAMVRVIETVRLAVMEERDTLVRQAPGDRLPPRPRTL